MGAPPLHHVGTRLGGLEGRRQGAPWAQGEPGGDYPLGTGPALQGAQPGAETECVLGEGEWMLLEFSQPSALSMHGCASPAQHILFTSFFFFCFRSCLKHTGDTF